MAKVKDRFQYVPVLSLATLLVLTAPLAAADDDTARALNVIKRVAREGQGNEDASPAWKYVVSQGLTALIPTLSAMKDADPAASNWLRTAVEAIAEGEKKAGRKLRAETLTAFVKDVSQSPASRSLAFELAKGELDEASAANLLRGFLDDPSLELRRDAIAQELIMVDNYSTAALMKLFDSARDKDQVAELAKLIEGRGWKASVTEHFGYVTHWQVIGPFDSTDGIGYDKPYPPESDPAGLAKCLGKDGKELEWKPCVTNDRNATVDFNKALGKHKFAVAYARATIGSDKAQPVEIRAAGQNAVKIFLNGEKLFGREEYHHGTKMDQHIARGRLRSGENTLLLKVCQNDQDQAWAQVWAVSCRLCDATGGALPLTQIVESAGQKKNVKLGYSPTIIDAKEKR